jgi:hypothetical protein
MSISSFRRLSIFVLLLALALVVPRPTAAGQRGAMPHLKSVAQEASLGVLGRLWSFLANVLSESGCMMDPDGRCTPHSAAPLSTTQWDEGCMMDPDGRCRG